MTNLDNTCSHNLDMAELDYNPSKRDLTDARIHHLLAEELKPYRRVCIVLRASISKLSFHNNHFDLDFYNIAVPVITTTTILKHIHTHSPSYRVPLFWYMSLVLDLTEANLRLVVVIVLYAFTLVFWAFRSETRSLLAISFLYPYFSTLCLSLSLSLCLLSFYIHTYTFISYVYSFIYADHIYIYIDIFVINCLFDFFPSNRTQLNLNFSTTTRIENI